jgi:hypothetical protein
LSIANQSWVCSKRGVSGWFWDIGQVPLRNFDWLPFTPPLVASSVLHKVTLGVCFGGLEDFVHGVVDLSTTSYMPMHWNIMWAENYIQQNSNMFVHCKYNDRDVQKKYY